MTRLIRIVLLCASTVMVTALAQAQTAPPTSAPTDLKAVPGNARNVLTWTAVAGVTQYKVYRGSTENGESAIAIATPTETTYTNAGLTNGNSYFYKVAAYNEGGAGPLSNEAIGIPLATPAGVTATAGDTKATIAWTAAAGATSYNVYRSTSTVDINAPFATGITALSFTDTGLTNGTTYHYRVRGVNASGVGAASIQVSAKPLPPPPAGAPTNLTATPGNAQIVLEWTPVGGDGVTGYKIFRGTAPDGEAVTAVATTSGTSYRNRTLTNGTTYFYKVAAYNMGGNGPLSAEVSATPVAPPLAPTDVTAAAGNGQVALNWTAPADATAFNVYRGTAPDREATTALASRLATPSFLDTTATNGPTYYYKVTATNAGGESPRSSEVSASPEAPQPPLDPATISAFRLLRQATWGPRPGDVEAVKAGGRDAFLADQFAAPISTYPDTLFTQSVEMTQERMMQLALTSPDQLRQRVAWSLHKIWVVSAVEVTGAPAIVTYQRILLNDAFGNYRDLMRDITLNPAMGRYLNMLNNRSQAVTGLAANENYAREIMQLFTLGIPTLDDRAIPVLDSANRQIPTYTEDDVKALARIFTGWTFGDGDPATIPNNLRGENYKVPMEAVERFHDKTAKVFLGANFPPEQTATADLDHALDVLFNHPNVGPFICKQLIQQLVTSNPSPGYIGSVVAVFNNNGAGVRGDLQAVVRAILTHPEAINPPASPTLVTSGKLMEPALYVISPLRALNAMVTDHPFMSDKAEAMGQKVFYPGSVFSYFSPGYRVRGTTLGGPEYQILTSVTALERANFAANLVGGAFGKNVTIDYKPFTTLAGDPAALVDYCSLLFMGGQMSPEQRREIINAIRVTPATNPNERVRTALYLTLAAAQFQVDR